MKEKEKKIDESDMEKRVEGFKQQYDLIVKKFEIILGAQPSFSPDGKIIAQMGFFSTRGMEVEKPKKNALVE